MDADLSLVLGPIVLAVVFNVRPVRLARLFLLAYTLSPGGRVRNVYHPVVQLLYLRVQGSMVHPVRALSQMPSGGGTHEFPQTPRRMGLLPGHLPHSCGDVHVVGIRGTELWKSSDLSSPPLVSLLNPHLVSPRTIESLRQAIPNHAHLQYVISLQRAICTILFISPPQL